MTTSVVCFLITYMGCFGTLSAFILSRPSALASSIRPQNVAQSMAFDLSKQRRRRRRTPLCLSSAVQVAEVTRQNDTSAELIQPTSPDDSSADDSPQSSPRLSQDPSLLALNRKLNGLAEKAGQAHQPSIAHAYAAEQTWREASSWDVVSFNTILKGWNRCTQRLAAAKKTLGEDDRAMMMGAPDAAVYTATDAATHALKLLNQQEADLSDGISSVAPDTTSFNTVIDSWVKSRDKSASFKIEDLLRRMMQSETAQPDITSYNSLIDAYTYSDRPDKMEKLTKLWKHIESSESVKPTVRTINSILHAHSLRVSREPENGRVYADKAASILRDMKERYEETGDSNDQPDVITFNTVMDCYARCGGMEAATCAESLWKELKDLYAATNDNRFRPNIYTYSTLIKAWSRARTPRAPRRAEELLEELLQDDHVQPNERAFTGVIQAWARSKDKEKSVKCLRLLQRMRELSKQDPAVTPSLVTYNTAIDACATTRGDAKQQTASLKIAFAILKTIQLSGTKPNHSTFGTLLKAVGFLLPPGEERNGVATAVFEKALAAGQVEASVVKNLQHAADVSVLQKILPKDMQTSKGYIDYKRIPPSWGKNVQERSR